MSRAGMQAHDWYPVLVLLSEGWAVEISHHRDRSGPPSSWTHEPVFVVYARRGTRVAKGRHADLATAIGQARTKARAKPSADTAHKW